MKWLTRELLGWGVLALLLGACAAKVVAPPLEGTTPQARWSDLTSPRGTRGAVTSSSSPALCE
jgi:hypothetical protein